MSKPPNQLILTGNVHPAKPEIASVGDVAVHPGAGGTSFIDGSIFDGGSWRALDLGGFGFRKGGRFFDHSAEIGERMRKISKEIAKHKGQTVHYGTSAKGKHRKYVFRGIDFASGFHGSRNFF